MKVSLAVALLIHSTNAHRHHHQNHLAKKRLYTDTKAGRQWWELDDQHERIHDSGLHKEDENGPHDDEVADAPEDIPRVGNDHQALHNAKLSPDGYHNGFYHKDFEGKFAQKKAQE